MDIDTENIEAKKKTDTPERKDPEALETEARKVFEESMKTKKAEIEELLQKIEKRNTEFRELADELKMSGRSSAGGQGQSEDEKAKASAMKLIAGSGFEGRIKL